MDLEQLIAEIDSDAEQLIAEIKAVNYGARVGQTIVGNLARGQGGRFSSAGSATGRRDSARLTAEARRQARSTLARRTRQTPDQKLSAKEKRQQANREKVWSAVDLPTNGPANLLALARGEDAADDGLVAVGLAEKDRTGKLRLTPQGRAFLTAANRGDAGRARDALSLGKDRVAARDEREKAKTARDAERAKNKAERDQQRAERDQERADKDAQRQQDKAERTAKPSREEQQAANRQSIADTMTEANAGLSADALDALFAFADGASGNGAVLMAMAKETGLIEEANGTFRMSPQGRRFVRAANRGDVRGALDALSEALDRAKDNVTTDEEVPDELKSLDLSHKGAMIAFVLDDETQQALIAAVGEQVGMVQADHLTLCYLAPDAEQLESQKNWLIKHLTEVVANQEPIAGVINGFGRFVGTEEGEQSDALYASFDAVGLPKFQNTLVHLLEVTGVPYGPTHGFIPHITLAYMASDAPTPAITIPRLPITFDEIYLVWGGEVLSLPLEGEPMPTEPEPITEPMEYDDSTDSAVKSIDIEEEIVIYGGSEVKAMGEEGHIGGYLVRFTGPNSPDLTGDFFTKNTDFGIVDGQRTPVWFNHRQPIKTRDGRYITIREQIGEGVLKKDNNGVLIDAILYNRERYEKAVSAMGWTSGTAAHLVDRTQVGKAYHIDKWLLGLDASITPIPAAGPGVTQVIPLKSYEPAALEAHIEAPGDGASAGDAAAVDISTATTEDTTMPIELEELKSLLEGSITAAIAPLAQRLEAIENGPAVKSAGFLGGQAPAVHSRDHSFDDFLKCVAERNTRRLRGEYKAAWGVMTDSEFKDLGEGALSTGGALVPPEYEAEVSRMMGEGAIFTDQRVRLYPMNAASKFIPALDQTGVTDGDGSDPLYGGVSFTWEPENGEITEKEPKFEMIELRARKAAVVTVSSNELTDDAPQLASDVQGIYAEALPARLDYSYMRGNGVGKPLGILNSPALVTVARKTAAQINIEDVAAILARCLSVSPNSTPIWMAHQLVLEQLIPLKIGDTPVFVQNAAGPVAGTLLGKPIVFGRFLPALGNAGDIGLYDLKGYAVGRRRGMTIAMSEHANFTKDQMTWRVVYRGDGQPRLKAPIKLPDGSNTQVSPFVRLGDPA